MGPGWDALVREIKKQLQGETKANSRDVERLQKRPRTWNGKSPGWSRRSAPLTLRNWSRNWPLCRPSGMSTDCNRSQFGEWLIFRPFRAEKCARPLPREGNRPVFGACAARTGTAPVDGYRRPAPRSRPQNLPHPLHSP